MSDTNEVSNKKSIRTWGIVAGTCSFLIALWQSFVAIGGSLNSKAFGIAVNHPAAFSELCAEAFGASLLAPLVHIAIASLFKPKRNSQTRWRIIFGWSAALILLAAIRLIITPAK